MGELLGDYLRRPPSSLSWSDLGLALFAGGTSSVRTVSLKETPNLWGMLSLLQGSPPSPPPISGVPTGSCASTDTHVP